MIEIYSKVGCGYCDAAKELFKQKGLQYTEYVIESTISRDDFFKKFPEAKTVPQIVIDGEYVGGYTNLLEWMDNDNGNLLSR